MIRDAAQKWFDAFVTAWKTYDEGAIADLRSENAVALPVPDTGIKTWGDRD